RKPGRTSLSSETASADATGEGRGKRTGRTDFADVDTVPVAHAVVADRGDLRGEFRFVGKEAGEQLAHHGLGRAPCPVVALDRDAESPFRKGRTEYALGPGLDENPAGCGFHELRAGTPGTRHEEGFRHAGGYQPLRRRRPARAQPVAGRHAGKAAREARQRN